MLYEVITDPDAGLVVPRSQVVCGILIENAEKTGKLKSFANTPATGLIIEGGRIKGVETPRGTILAGAGLRLYAGPRPRGPATKAGTRTNRR